MSSIDSTEFHWDIFPYRPAYFSQVKRQIETAGLRCDTGVLPDLGFVIMGTRGVFKEVIGGYIGAHIKYHQHARIDILVVDRLLRNKMIGMMLIKRMFDCLQTMGVLSVDGEVEHTATQAIRLYEKLGATLKPRLTFDEGVTDIIDKIEIIQDRIVQRSQARKDSAKGLSERHPDD